MTAEEVAWRRAKSRNLREIIAGARVLGQALLAIGSGVFSTGNRRRCADLVASLYDSDRFMAATDFDAYSVTQRKVYALWADEPAWYGKMIRYNARVGWFSSGWTYGSTEVLCTSGKFRRQNRESGVDPGPSRRLGRRMDIRYPEWPAHAVMLGDGDILADDEHMLVEAEDRFVVFISRLVRESPPAISAMDERAMLVF